MKRNSFFAVILSIVLTAGYVAQAVSAAEIDTLYEAGFEQVEEVPVSPAEEESGEEEETGSENEQETVEEDIQESTGKEPSFEVVEGYDIEEFEENSLPVTIGSNTIEVSVAEGSLYKFVPECNDTYTFFTESDYDTVGSLFCETNGNVDALAADDDSGDEFNFSFSYELEEEKAYYLGIMFIDYDSGSGTRTITLHVTRENCSRHTPQEGSGVVTEATCTRNGYTTYTCSNCGQEYEDDYTPAGHRYNAYGICIICGAQNPDIGEDPEGNYEDDDFTLSEDGTLVIRCNEGVGHKLFDNELDPDLHDVVPVARNLFVRTVFPIGTDNWTEYLNPNVREILIEEGTGNGEEEISVNHLLWRFPNVEKITTTVLVDVSTVYEDGLGIEEADDFEEMLEENRLTMESLVSQWNSRYRHKLASPEREGWIYYTYIVDSPDLTIASPNFEIEGEDTLFGDLVTSYRFTYEEYKCELDKLLSPIANGSCFYDGKSHVSAIKDYMYIKCEGGHGEKDPERPFAGNILKEGKDYTVEYYNERTRTIGDVTNAGSIRVTVTGKGTHTGELRGYYTICPQALRMKNIELAQESVVYDGKAKKPGVTVKNKAGQILEPGVDYEVSYYNNTEVGNATAAVTGIGNYMGEIRLFFKIFPAASSKVTLTNVADGIKISWNKVNGATSYYVYRNNVYLFRTSALVVTDKAVKFNNGTKYVYKVVATTKNIGDSPKARTATGYRLMTAGIKSLKNSGPGKMTVTYEKNASSSGYVVRYGLKSDMSDAKVITVKGADTTARSFGGLIKGKTYYVQARAYIIENGIRYYSGYCTTKTVKITK